MWYGGKKQFRNDTAKRKTKEISADQLEGIMKLQHYIIFLFLSIFQFAFCQLKSDSVLKNYRERFPDDSVMLSELDNLIENLDNPADWKVLNDSLLKLSLKKTLEKNNGKMHYFRYLLTIALNNKGLYFRETGFTDSAIYYYKAASSEARKINRKDQLARTLNNIGFVYGKKGDYREALNYYFDALRLFTELDEKKDMARLKNNIGYIYHEENEKDLAYKYFKESAENSKKLGDMKAYCSSVINYTSIIKDHGDLETARKNILDLIPVVLRIKDEKTQAYIYFNLGSLWFESNLDSSLKYYNHSLELRRKTHNQPGIISCESRIGNIYFLQGKKKKAEKLLKKSFDMSVETGYVSEQRETSLWLWKLYKEQGNYRDAYRFYEHYILINDSMQKQKSKQEGIRKMFEYEFKKKATADSVKHKEQQKIRDAQFMAQKAQIEQEKFQRYTLVAGLVLVLGGLTFVVNRYRVTQKQKKIIENQKRAVDEAFMKLEEKNKEVLDSIHYAKRIQRTLITSEKYIGRKLAELKKK